MNQMMGVEPLEVLADEYDGFFAAIGFEQRSRYVAERCIGRAKQKLACGFQDRHVLSYSQNLAWFGENGYKCDEVSDAEFISWAIEKAHGIPSQRTGTRRICVDVSSFSRIRIAVLLETLRTLGKSQSIELDVVYCGAEFSPPCNENVPNLSIGPIMADFAGWSIEPDRPPVLILGLGYEYDKAIGAVEYIEPAAIWAFEPTGHDPRYSEAIIKANRTLWDVLPTERRIRYSVYHPFDCFVSLESLTYGLAREVRPILVPFGPKLFAVCCLLVSFAYPTVSVWRVSSGQLEPPAERIPNGKIAGLRIRFAMDALSP